jgi:hypothetical protein
MLKGKQIKRAYFLLIATAVSLSGQAANKNAPSPPRPDNWERSKECASQAEKLVSAAIVAGDKNDSPWKMAEWSNHYSPKYFRCFVHVSYTSTVAAQRQGEPVARDDLWDAFERSILASSAFGGSESKKSFYCVVDRKIVPCEEADQFIQERMKNWVSACSV